MRKPPKRCAESLVGHNSSSLENIAPELLKRLPGDPRTYSRRDIELAVEVMRHHPPGTITPLLVNGQHEVLVGWQFVEAARKLGLKLVTVVRQDHLSPTEQKQYSVAINQLLTRGGWDASSLETWVRDFEATIENFSHFSIGMDNGEFDKLLSIAAALGATPGTDTIPALQSTAISRPGMIWHAGWHRIMVGDATCPDTILRLLAGETVAYALTDPPFGCKIDGFVSSKGKHREFLQGSGDMTPEELEDFFRRFSRNLALVLRKGALVYIFIDWRSLHVLLRACEEVFGPLLQFCCWVKDRAGMGSFYRSQHELVLVYRMPGAAHMNNVQLGKNGRNRSNVWEYPSAASTRSGREGDMLKKHPTPKPVELVADAISTAPPMGIASSTAF